MPEGPEIRRAADQIATVLQGQPITEIVFGLDRLKPYESKLRNATITRIETRGKAMLTHFDSGLFLYSHNQLYGRWEVLQPGEVSESKLGPDLFEPTLNTQTIRERLLSPKFRNRQLGGFLTDQSFVAGLGNYLRCEILFLCKLPLSAKPADCSATEIEQLAEQILQLPRQSYQTGGITYLPNRAKSLMEAGQTREESRFWVFRRDGLPCRSCGATIEKRSGSGQPCYLCPQCQPDL